jgi:hypothetical protein
VTAAFISCCIPSFAQDKGGEQDRYIYPITHSGDTIVVDGVLSEHIWGTLPAATGFWMSYPVDDRKVEPERQTDVRLTCDDRYIYLGVICYGSDDYIIKTLKRDKDFWDGDAFGVVIDPVDEKTNGFVFGVSPAGVQTEFLVTGQTGRRQYNEMEPLPEGVNMAWDNRWLSAVANYADRWTIEIAIPFKTLRFDESRKQWGINFFRFDAGTNSINTWAPVPIEFREIDLGYTGTLVWDEPPEKARGNLALIPYVMGSGYKDHEAGEPVGYDFQPGLDVKYPVTAGLTLDLTVNPDFSQVEVDEQIVNLTLFDIMLPEKRLFFLENSDIFEDFGIPPMRPFFSRKIGLDEAGNPIPILYGARLSGNVNKDLRIGLMNLQTRTRGGYLPQNYTAVAFHQKVFARSMIKGYVHNRQLIREGETDYNRNMGLEFRYMSKDGRFQSLGGYAKSFSPGLHSRNYFYNTAIGYDNRNISIYSNLAGLGRNYVPDMGFFMGQEYYDAERDTSIRVTMNHLFTTFSYTLYPEQNEKIISHEFSARHIYDSDSTFSMLSNDAELGYTMNFSATGRFRLSFSHTVTNLLFPFAFIEDEPLPSGRYSHSRLEVHYESDQRRRFSMQAGVSCGSFYNGTRTQYTAGIKYRAQPWGNFSLNFEQNDLKFPEPYGSDRLLLISPRIEISFSTSLFWTTFVQYNTQDDNFNINSRLQWRFRPMSDLYIVYTDNYAVEFWGPKTRALVFKLNYWFNL